MHCPLARKLLRGTASQANDVGLLELLTIQSTLIDAREAIVREGDQCESIYVVVSGWACRFKSRAGLGRQIVGFLLPGDHVCGERALREMDYGVSTLTRCDLAETSLDDLQAMLRDHPVVDRALRRAALVDEAISREWLLGLGRRSAEKRMAHLFCELLARLQVVGLAGRDAFPLPLTQLTLGDALGLSAAHVNRSLQNLRARRLVSFENGFIEIENVERLQKFASFSPQYLHLEPFETPQADKLEAGSVGSIHEKLANRYSVRTLDNPPSAL